MTECQAVYGVQGGCIIRAGFLDDIKNAYKRNPDLENLVLDDWFADKLVERNDAWREVVKLGITNGQSAPAPPHLTLAASQMFKPETFSVKTHSSQEHLQQTSGLAHLAHNLGQNDSMLLMCCSARRHWHTWYDCFSELL